MTTTTTAYIGVGCFAFIGTATTAGDWFKEVTDALGQIGSIKEIGSESVNPFLFGHTNIPDASNENNDVLQPTIGSVYFTISIPERIQQRFSPDVVLSQRKLNIGTEFLATTQFYYHGPVTFIECLDCPPNTDASSAVALVREYLQSELKKVDGSVHIETTGPSPFHTDFFVVTKPGSKPNDDDAVNITKAPGYNRCTLTFHTDDIPVGIIKEILPRVFGGELSLYYYLVRDRNARRREMEIISSNLQALTALHQRKGIRGKFARVFRSSSMARQLILDVLMAETQESQSKRDSDEALKHLKEQPNRLLFPEKLQEETSISYLPELRAIKDSASMLESGRTKDFEVAVISLATLLGAAAGALASLISK